ncbi:MAG: GGDEF domain-containing protein [Lachnospiraceae bacterium]|nr:GGDEF domain-containing protein [Lachnospiraceae bacterium]
MKNSLELIFHTIRQVFAGKQLIDNSNKYRIMCLITAFIHLVFCVSMGAIGANILCYYNIFIVYFYCFLGIVLTNRKKFRVIMVLFFIEVEFHSSMASLMLGWDWGFMLYTVALIPAAFYLANSLTNRNKHVAYSIWLSAFVMVSYIVVSVVQSRVPPIYGYLDNSAACISIRYFNIFIAFSLLLVFSALFALETNYMEQLLEKENLKLGIEASYDPLTRLLNRRSMTRYMSDEIEIANDTTAKFCLVMLDIDDFKTINDSYGHDIGDKVLVALAELIKAEVRESDYSCRWGGEEFLLFIHGDKQETYFVADRIRRKLEETTLKNKYDGTFRVTATFGIAEYKSYMPLRTIIDEADEKLYYGKNHGKNQVVV